MDYHKLSPGLGTQRSNFGHAQGIILASQFPAQKYETTTN